MQQRQRARTTLGLDCDGNSILACLLVAHRNGLTCQGLWRLPKELEHPLPDELLLRTPHHGAVTSRSMIDQVLSVAATTGSQVLLRPLDIGLVKRRDVAAILPYQAEAALPYPAEEATLDWLPRAEEGKITLLGIRNEEVESTLQEWRDRGLELEQLSTPAAALTAFATTLLSQEGPLLLIHIGESESTLLRLQGSTLQHAYSIPIGAGSSDAVLNPSLMQELSRASFALRKNLTVEEQGQLRLYLTGTGSTRESIVAGVEERLSLAAEPLPEKNVLRLPTPQLQRYALAIGLALAALEGSKSEGQVDFRQGIYAYPWPWRRLWRPVVAFIALCLTCATLLYLTANAWSSRELARLRADYRVLTSSMELSLTEAENLHRRRMGLSTLDSDSSPDKLLNTLSRFDIEQRLATLDDELKKRGSPIPLIPRTPRVSDVLAWLATTPEFSQPDRDGKPPLTLESFDYTLVKRPDKGRPREHYRVKIDLEFSAASPRAARAFHDRLLESLPLIDPKGELKWSTPQGRYRATFFLRDTTRYHTRGV